MKTLAKVTMSLVLLAGAIEARAVTIYSQDFNANNGGFTVLNAGTVGSPFTYSIGNGSWSTDGSDPGIGSSAISSPTINVTAAGAVTLTFLHRYNFEFDGANRFDGGAVFISVNGGGFSHVPAAHFLSNGYASGTITGSGALNGLGGFNGVSGSPTSTTPGQDNGVFLTSVASLGSFALGDTISVRFLGAWDEFDAGNSPNWEITSLQLDSVAAATIPEPATALFGVLGLAALAKRRRAMQA